ncbi:T9SS type A sorting domain-containing protein [Fluviicola taffensis]|uniref:T9SS type A sorting domain-containing protein n=1 Tax=Fluviicola taffensis TaxID=191579 RepID=UPI0031377BE1
MYNFLSLTFLSALLAFSSLGQTGPAGVGTSATNVLWLKADAGTSTSTNGSPVASWNDQSGNGVILNQGTTAQQPQFVSSLMNGFPALEFDNNSSSGQNDYLITPDNPIFDNTNGYSFFTVTRMKGFGDAQSIISKRNNVGNEEAFMLFYYTGNKLFVDIDNDNNRFSNSAVSAINTNKIYDFFYDGTLLPPQRSTIFDQEVLQTTSVESSSTIPDKNSPLIVGATHSGDPRAFNGYISEIIMYRTKLNDAQRAIINNHLSAKYDIALSSNDWYVGDNPSNGNYDRNVAGIGMDAAGTSNPQFNPSTCAGIGIQTVSGLDNLDYILVGHASPANSEATTDIAGITGTNASRWQRIWYIDVTNTGAANIVNLTFDMSDGGMAGVNLGALSNYILVYRSAQTGSWTEIATANAIVGDQISFANQSLTSDGYYTLASKDFTMSPLPVELVYFDATLTNGQVALAWETASEFNSSYFDVLRSDNGENWSSIGTVPAQGNSQITLDYSLIDESPLSGVSYYQLKEVDLNGSFHLSDIESINNSRKVNQVKIYPNPTDKGLVTVVSDEPITTLFVYNALGETVFEVRIDSDDTYLLDTQSFESGMYWINLNGEKYKLIVR